MWAGLPRGDRHERDPLLIEQLDQLSEIGERAGEAIDLVDHHGVDLAGLPVQSRPRSGAVELHLIVDGTGLKLPVNHRRMSDLGQRSEH